MQIQTDEERKAKARERTRRYRERHPERARESNLRSNRKWREKDPEAHRRRVSEWYAANKGQVSEREKKRRADQGDEVRRRDRERYAANPEPKKQSVKAWQKENPETIATHSSRRRSSVRQATPPWLTKEQRREMSELRKRARQLTADTGVLHHVDHIYALRGKNFCGLNVPWNLQILVGTENIKKGITPPSHESAFA